MHNDPSGSPKVVDFDTDQKRVCDSQLVLNTNLGFYISLFQRYQSFCTSKVFFPYFTPIPANFRGVPFGVDP